MKPGKILLLILLAVLIAAFFLFDFGQYFDLAFIKAKQADIDTFYIANPITAALSFFFIYIIVTGLSLPGAAIMTLIGGAIFGLAWGTVLVSFASTIGATLAFLVSRYILRDVIQKKFARQLKPVNEGIEKDGGFYLFTLRLVPAFPFFIINLVMGLTHIRTIIFFLVSQIGMLPGTIVYINAG
ncbi:MAG: TVP38/TMEM64 family protein, partial [Gammaproteobacteria bacterium]